MPLGRVLRRLRGLALLLGELLASLRPPSVPRRVARFATVSKAVSASLRRLLAPSRSSALLRLLSSRLLLALPLLGRLSLALLVLTRFSASL